MKKQVDSIENPLVVEYTFEASVEKVWAAITDPTQMKIWYFDLPGFRAETGYTFQFEGGPPEKVYLHLCEITEVAPQEKLTYSWKYEGYAGNSFVTFALFEKDGKTLLQLTHRGLDSFPADNPDFAAANFKAGWTDIIGRSLKEHLASTA